MSKQPQYRAPGSTEIGFAQMATAVALCFCAGGLYGWSALISVVESTFGANTEQAALVFSCAIVAFTLAVYLVPRLPDAFRGLSGCSLFGFVGAGCLLLSTLVTTYIQFLLAFSLGFGFSSGAMYINALTIASASSRPALMTPVTVAAFSLGGAVFGPLWRVLASQDWGLNALLILAGVLTFIAIVGQFIPANRSSEFVSTSAHERIRIGIDKTLILTLIWLSFALGSAGGLMVLGLASKIIDIEGGTIVISSIALAGIAIANTVGRLSVGGLANVMSPSRVAILSAVTISVGLVITGSAQSAEISAAGLVVVALGYGILASAIPNLVGVVFGKHNFARMFSIVFTAWGVAGLSAPWIAGVIFDRTGSFSGAIMAALIASLSAIGTVLLLGNCLKRTAIQGADQ